MKLLEYVVPLFDEKGDPKGSVGAFLDITARHQTEKALKEADQRKDEFLAMLAHELRSPLSALSNALFILRMPGASDQKRQWALDVAERQRQTMVRLIDDLLDVSRIARGKIQLKKGLLDARDVVNRAVESARPFIEGRGHELTVSVGSCPLLVDGDSTRLEQVLSNLLNNAAKYTDDGGRIWLSAGMENDEVIIRVRDTGIGIAPEMQHRVFELFAQVDVSIHRSRGGLGLGLTLVRSLVEIQGGSVSASSEGPGMGSEFTVRLPSAPIKDPTDDESVCRT